MLGSRQCTAAVCGVIFLGIVLLLGHVGAEARPRKVLSKGIEYTLAVAHPDDTEPFRLFLDPGKEAWLEPAWGGGNRAAIRSGHGLKWSYIRDTRKGVVGGFLFLEVEPLEGLSFDEAADRYRNRLRGLWELSGATFERVTNEKATKPMKIDGQRIKGRRLLQEVREKRDAKLHGATSVLLPVHGHLVVLTGYGKWDPVPSALRSLRCPPTSWAAKGHTYHCVDFVGSPQVGTFVVLPLPVGYDVVPVSATEKDATLVNRFRRSAADSTAGTVTLTRLMMNPDTTPRGAVDNWVTVQTAQGLSCADPQPGEMDGQAFQTISYVSGEEAEGAPVRGWLGAWKSKCGVYAVQWETTEMDAELADMARAELLASFRKLQTWNVQLPW